MDQDSERTSSMLPSGKATSRRSAPATHSRQGIVAGIAEVESLGPSSLRSSPHNAALAIQPGDDADDMTVVAQRTSGIPDDPSEAERTTPDGGELWELLAALPKAPSTASPTASPAADSGVNPRRILEATSEEPADLRDRATSKYDGKHDSKGLEAPLAKLAAPQAERAPRPFGGKSRVGVQWAIALLVALGAASYILSQPAANTDERHWVSGRSR